MRMCKEILIEGKVHVKRDDAKDLLSVRFGSYSYDRLIEEAERLEQECEALYVTSTLRKEPDRQLLDDFVVKLTLAYAKHNGEI